MRYIGGKANLVDIIIDEIRNLHAETVIDVFAGSGVVSSRLDASGFKVISNDILHFSYIINKANLTLSHKPEYSGLSGIDPINFLNHLTIENTPFLLDDCFIWKNYSHHNGCERMYFQEKNALRIDLIRKTIESWRLNGQVNDTEYTYLLSRLILSVPYVSNIAGVYGAYLKHWDTRSFKDLVLLEASEWAKNAEMNQAYNVDYQELLPNVQADVLYADPPYNTRQYLPNYHVLETISRYDYPEIKGVTGMRPYEDREKSDFCSRVRVKNAFEELIRLAQVNHVIISYNNEGLMSTADLAELCQDYAISGTFKLLEFPYRRYKNHTGSENRVNEQMYIFSKR